MDAARALADLTEISSQIEAAVLADEEGALLASTLADEERARRFADGARRLLAEAEAAGPGGAPVQLEAAMPEGSVFVVRGDGRLIAAATGPEPTVGLVFYDLKTCLRSVEEAPGPAPRRKAAARRKAADDAEA